MFHRNIATASARKREIYGYKRNLSHKIKLANKKAEVKYQCDQPRGLVVRASDY